MKESFAEARETSTGLFGPLKGKSTGFWGVIMIAVGGLWLLLKLLPFILGFAIPALIIYAGYVLMSNGRRGVDKSE